MNDTPTPLKRRTGKAAAPPDLDAWLAGVAEVGPLAERLAPQADEDRRLSAELMAGLHERGLFRLLLPHGIGGHELPVPSYFRVIEAIAAHDTSAAWCVTQGNCCAMLGGYVDRAVAESIWGDPSAVLAWGPGKTEASAVDGGYSVTARNAFASGIHHATWLGAHATPVREPDGSVRTRSDGAAENRTMLFPAAEAEIVEQWDVVGLRGTGSDGYRFDELFVPEAFTIVRADMIDRRPPHGEGALYVFPQMAVHATGFAATATGTARGFIDAFLEMAQNKVPRGHEIALRDNAVVQDDVGLAEARLSAGRAGLLAEAERAWEEAAATGALTLERRMRIRLAATHAIREAKAAVDILFDAAGTSSVFESTPFERRFRDVHMVAQQIQGRRAHYRSVGAWMLGQAPDMSVI